MAPTEALFELVVLAKPERKVAKLAPTILAETLGLPDLPDGFPGGVSWGERPPGSLEIPGTRKV